MIRYLSFLLVKTLPNFGFNFKFHWTEILIDVAYQFPEYVDLYKPFYVGPGAQPTLKRLSKGDYQETLHYLASLQLKNFNYVTYKGNPVALSFENWEGIACEFRKYINLNDAKGRKRYYRT